MKICPKCGAALAEVIGGYMCHECGGTFGEDNVIIPQCPYCDYELQELGDEFYCYNCSNSVRKEDAVYSKEINYIEDDYGLDERDYDSMVNNGEQICLNCTYWSTSPYGAAHGMICRRGYPTSGPGDSCSDFVQSHSFASYGDSGQYQFNETSRDISNRLYNWKNNR